MPKQANLKPKEVVIKVVIAGLSEEEARRYLGKSMFNNRDSTSIGHFLGIDFYLKIYHVFNLKINCQFCVLSSDERFRTLTPKYMKAANAVIVIDRGEELNTKYYLLTALRNDFNPENIILLNKEDISKKLFKFSAVLSLNDSRTITHEFFTSYKRKLSPKINLLSEIQHIYPFG